MVPEWLQGTKKKPFGITLECVLGMFDMFFDITFCARCNAFVQGCGGLNSYFRWKIVSSLFYSIVFWHVLLRLCLLCRRGRGRAARRSRRPQELPGHAKKSSPFLLHLCLPVLCAQQLWSIFSYSDLALNALPVHLMKFSMVLWERLWGYLGGFWGAFRLFWVHLGLMLSTFRGPVRVLKMHVLHW